MPEIVRWTPTDPSLFDRPLELVYKVSSGIGSRGEPLLSDWLSEGTIFAFVQCMTGRELQIARQVVATATHLVVTRYYSVVTAQKAFRFGQRIFNINLVKNMDEKNQELQSLCSEEIPG